MKMRIASIVLTSAAVVTILVWLLTDGGAGLFATSVHLTTFMPDATGLEADAPVRLDGIRVGTVKHVAISGFLDHQRAVRVDLQIQKSYLAKIPADSLTSVGSDTMVGDKFIDIAAGKSSRTATGGGELQSEPAESAADKADLILGLQNSLRKVDSMVAQIASPDTPVGHYIVGEREYKQALGSLAAFEAGMRSLVSHGSPTSDAVFSTSLYSKFDKSLREFDDTLQSIERGEGTAGHLFASDEQYNDTVRELRDLRKTIVQIREDMEKEEPGLRDEQSYIKVRRALASTNTALAALNRGEGAVGELLTSPQLYETLVGSLNSLRDLVKDFGERPDKYLRTKLF